MPAFQLHTISYIKIIILWAICQEMFFNFSISCSPPWKSCHIPKHIRSSPWQPRNKQNGKPGYVVGQSSI